MNEKVLIRNRKSQELLSSALRQEKAMEYATEDVSTTDSHQQDLQWWGNTYTQEKQVRAVWTAGTFQLHRPGPDFPVCLWTGHVTFGNLPLWSSGFSPLKCKSFCLTYGSPQDQRNHTWFSMTATAGVVM